MEQWGDFASECKAADVLGVFDSNIAAICNRTPHWGKRRSKYPLVYLRDKAGVAWHFWTPDRQPEAGVLLE